MTTPTGPDAGGDAPRRPRPGREPRHAHEVTPAHVGARVSIRHRIDDPELGRVPTDVVGRLLAHDDEVLLVVDRHSQLTVVDASAVVASRVLPPHPRLPPEPEVGTEDAPLERDAARVLLLDATDRVLLVAHAPARGHRVWTAPGGGLRPGESHEDAARRELVEELGVQLEPGPWVWSRDVTFTFRGVWLRQRERWYLARGEVDATAAPLDDAGTDEARWWRPDELRATTDDLAPRHLTDHLEQLLADGPPDAPIDVGR